MPPDHQLKGIAAAHRLRERHAELGVVVLSAHADEAYARELFRDGTRGLGYLLKDRVGDRAEIMHAVRTVAVGGSVIDPVVVESMLARHAARERSGLGALSPRETEVLEHMAGGFSNGAIAERMFLSLSAVEKHISAIFTKLGLVEETATHRRVAAVLAYLGDR